MLKVLNRIKNTIIAIAKKLFSPEAEQQAQIVFGKILGYVETLLPIVRIVAAATPTQLDDWVVVLLDKVVAFGDLGPERQAAVLKAAAVRKAREEFPALVDVPDHELYTAIDIAYALYRAKVKADGV